MIAGRLRGLRLPPGASRFWGLLLLAWGVLYLAVALWPELVAPAPPLNDDVLHRLATAGAARALAQGGDPTDFWLPGIGLGYPLAHHYQHLPYLPPALLATLSSGAFSPTDAYLLLRYLLLAAFPAALYWAAVRFGLPHLAAGGAAAAAPVLATNGLFGFDVGSYIWRGSGLYTQAWAMVLMPPALAETWAVVQRRGRPVLAAVLLAGVVLSHLVLGYATLLTVAAFLVLSPRTDPPWRRLRALAPVALLLGACIAYFAVPFLADRAFLNRSVWEPPWKYDSFGAPQVLAMALRGELFDAGRFPALTLLVGVGVAASLWHWRQEGYRAVLAVLAVWLALYAGRPTWGPLLDLLPMARELHLHRMIAGVHLGGLLLAGIGLRALFTTPLPAVGRLPLVVVAAAAGALLLATAYHERTGYLQTNLSWMAQSRAAASREAGDLAALVDRLRSLPPGRVYAGLATNWGAGYRVGQVPVYALLQTAGLDCLGYLYHALSLNSEAQVWFDERRAEHYELFNVRYVVAPAGHQVPSFLVPVARFGRHQLYRSQASGYFQVVHTTEPLRLDRALWRQAVERFMASGLPAASVLPQVQLAGAGGDLAPLAAAEGRPPPAPPPGRVTAEEAGPGALAALAETTAPALLAVKVTYHPGWEVRVDGAPVRPVMLLPSLVGVPLPGGVHRVELVYRPPAVRAWLQALALAALAAALAFPHLRRPLAAAWAHAAPRLPRPGPAPAGPANGPAAAASAPPAAPATMPRAPLVGLYLLLAAVYLATAAGHFWSTDHVATYLTAQSLAEGAGLAIKPINDAVLGPDGRSYAVFGIGHSLAVLPLYLLGRTLDGLVSPEVRALLAGPNLGDWGGTVPIFVASLFNQLVMPLVAVLVALLSRALGASVRAALAVALAFGVGTLAWEQAHSAFQHPLEALSVTAAVYLLVRRRHALRPADAALAGVCLGYGVLTRINMLVLVLPLGLYLLLGARPAGAPAAAGAAAWRLRARAALPLLGWFAVPVALGLAGAALVAYLRFGNPLAFHPRAVEHGFSLARLPQGLWGYLASPGRSLLLHAPPLLVAAPLWLRLAMRRRAEALLVLGAAAAYLLLFASYGRWHGDWAYGPRLLTAVLPLLVVPAFHAVDLDGRWRAAFVTLTLAGAVIQFLGVAVNVSYVYHQWLAAGVPESAYLFSWPASAVPTHAAALLAGRHVDLWLDWVYRTAGPGGLAAPLAVLLALAAAGLALLGRGLRPGQRGAGPPL